MFQADLRPLGFGEILDGAFTLYRRHFVSFFVTALVPFVPIAILSAEFTRRSAALQSTPDASLSDFPWGWMLAAAIVATVGISIVWGALTREISAAVTGGEVSAEDGYGTALRALLPLLGAGVLAWGVMVGAVTLATLLFGLATAAFAVAGGIAALFFGLLGALAIGFMFAFLAASFFAMVPAVVVEKLGPWTALKRSWRLSRGARWRIVGLILVSYLITVLPVLGVGMATGTLGAWISPAAAAALSPGELAFQQVASTLSGALTTPFFVGCLVLLYYDRRVRSEGYDVELAAEGLAVAG